MLSEFYRKGILLIALFLNPPLLKVLRDETKNAQCLSRSQILGFSAMILGAAAPL